jgi:hypothetical protein
LSFLVGLRIIFVPTHKIVVIIVISVVIELFELALLVLTILASSTTVHIIHDDSPLVVFMAHYPLSHDTSLSLGCVQPFGWRPPRGRHEAGTSSEKIILSYSYLPSSYPQNKRFK